MLQAITPSNGQIKSSLPFFLDQSNNLVFISSVEKLAQVEKAKLLAVDKRAPGQYSRDYYILLQQLYWLRNHQFCIEEFKLNPYWRVALTELSFHRYADFGYLCSNGVIFHEKLQQSLLKEYTALKYDDFIKPILESVKQQKAVFKRYLDKHKQINCIFMDLHFVLDNPVKMFREEQLLKVARKWLGRLHQSSYFDARLTDIHWRIVKSLKGYYSVQALIYVIGEKKEYADLITTEWGNVCLANGYSNSGLNYVLERHCYYAHTDMCSFWRKMIEDIHVPLKIYRFESEDISFKWKKYTGNI
ncbi:hypothetical protein [Acinetobacter sp. HR7]|uniref:hypothetical protein n=1 Tax=Acinetobacter sp. HR7 TaxID=1509403 RepID=UPI0009D78B49|nr:hypothetical protein [Acinetobacter sp. HR7]